MFVGNIFENYMDLTEIPENVEETKKIKTSSLF